MGNRNIRSADKKSIRQHLLGRRNTLTKLFVRSASKNICQKLIRQSEFLKAKVIMFYVSKDNEVDTKNTIRHLLRSGKTICVPRVNNSRHRIEPIIINDFKTDLFPGKFGILEPKKGETAGVVDLIIVPGIAFDLKGYRIGWGKGYYDKFLEKKKKALKVGLAFNCQIVNKIPADKHDIPMDEIITERRTIRTSRKVK